MLDELFLSMALHLVGNLCDSLSFHTVACRHKIDAVSDGDVLSQLRIGQLS